MTVETAGELSTNRNACSAISSGGDAEVGDDRGHPLFDLCGAVVAEVAVAPVALGKRRTGGDPAGEAALVQRHPHDDTDAVLLTGRQQRVGRRLVEEVVDDLHAVHRAAAHECECVVGLVVVDGDPEQADLALLLQFRDRLQPVTTADPVIAPHMELEYVEVVQAAAAQTGLQALADVLAGERLGRVQSVGRRPRAVLRRYLGRDEHLVVGPLTDDPADDSLALAVAARRIDEVHAEVDGPVQGAYGFVLRGTHPAGLTDAPRAVSDLGHGQSTASQLAVAHNHPPRHRPRPDRADGCRQESR